LVDYLTFCECKKWNEKITNQEANQFLFIRFIQNSIMRPIFILCLLLLGLVSSCSSSKSTKLLPVVGQVDQRFIPHISGFSGGLISKNAPIVVELAEPKEGVELDRDLPNNGLFEFTPKIDGTIKWVSPYMVEFRPDKELNSEQVYQCFFHLSKIKQVEPELSVFSFYFKPRDQVYRLAYSHFENIENNRVIAYGSITSNDIIDTTKLFPAISASVAGKANQLSWQRKTASHYVFSSQPIARLSKPQTFRVSGKASFFGSEIKSEGKIPAIGEFTIVQVTSSTKDAQHALITFSELLDPLQDFKGRVQLDDSDNLTFIVDGNRLKVFPKNQLTGEVKLFISAMVQSDAGFKLGKDERIDIVFNDLPPTIEILGSGTIVPTTDGAHFPFKAINLKAVDVYVTKINSHNIIQFLQENKLDGSQGLKRVGKEIWRQTVMLSTTNNLRSWNNYAIDISKFIQEDPQAFYRVTLSYKKEYALYDCKEGRIADIDPLSAIEDSWSEEDWEVNTWYGGYYYDDYYDDYDDDYGGGYSGGNDWNNPCSARYYQNKQFSKNVTVSDIGMIAKSGQDKSVHVFVSDLRTTQPISGAIVQFYSFRQEILAEAKTNEQGHVRVPLREKPFVAVASHNGQKTYLRLRDSDSKSVSKFDVEGYAAQEGVKGYLYTERDVRRPGDSIYLSFMVDDPSGLVPSGHPVKMTLRNPMGVQVAEQVQKTSLNKVWAFKLETYHDWPTGNYTATVALGNRSYSKTIMIETVKPNRLRIDLSSQHKILSSSKESKLTLQSQWLHGADAAGLNAVVEMTLSGGSTKFDDFSKYHFDDPLKTFYSEESVVFEGTLDAKSTAEFIPEIYISESAPGMLNATFITKVFEGGGDFSIDKLTFKYAPFASFVGLLLPESNLFGGTLLTDENTTFDVALVDDKGKPMNGEVQLTIYKIDHNWWWDSYNRNIANYINRSSTRPMKEEKIIVRNGKASFTHKVAKNDWGRYYIKLSHEGGHSTGRLVTFDWPYWSRSNRGKDENAVMLGFSSDKSKYEVGQEVKLSIPSPKNGKALVSIENGSKVIAHHWVNTNAGETTFSFVTTEEMAPNVYVHVTMIQPHAATGNDLPIRMYGVVPIEVENKTTRFSPLIACADEWKPESKQSISVSNQERRPMTYTLAVVDEGLLDLTRFKTPDPWRFFYAKEALGVRTWDVYDDVLGAFGKRIDQLLAVGGDGEINRNSNPPANRFKPMVRFLGPFYYDGKTPNKHEIDVPNYVGSVRVMVVARGDQRDFGSAEKAVPVRNEIMVLSTLPRVMGPGEEVVMPVNVFNMVDGSKSVTVSVKGNDLLTPIGETSQQVKFDKKGDKIVFFRFSAKNKLGVGAVNVLATDGKTSARDEIELDIRASNPRVNSSEQFVLEPGQTLDHMLQLNGMEGTNEVRLELSSFPGINLDGRLGYLTGYPHGCLEQMISGGFPQLYVSKLVETDQQTRLLMQQQVQQVIERLPLYQSGSGGYSYWPGQNYIHPWAAVYAGHFMHEAEKNGYSVPWHIKYRWTESERNNARNWESVNAPKSGNTAAVQAYRLFVLAMMNQSDMPSMNRLRDMSSNLPNQAKWLLAGAYAQNGRKDIAAKIVNPTAPIQFTKTDAATLGSNVRDEAIALMVLDLMGEKAEAMKLAQRIVNTLNSNSWMSTQSAGFSLMAVSKFLNGYGNSGVMDFEYIIGSSPRVVKKTARQMLQVPVSAKNQKISIKNNGSGPMYVVLSQSGIPVRGTERTDAKVLAMNIRYYHSHTLAPLDPSKIEQGTDFTMEVEIKNDGSKGNLAELALNQVFPAGWEIHNSRMMGYASSSGIDYQDIRDDRVLSYFRLASSKTVKVKVRLNAAYLGKYYMPGILAEAMYDNNVRAFQSGTFVEVVPKAKKSED
jgi:alpha-2-macroglobulin